MTDYKIVIVAVVDGGGKLLMIRRVHEEGDENSGKWEFPAGHVDPGEIPEIAAIREVSEETGLKVYLMPWHIDVQTKAGMAAQFIGFVQGGDREPEPVLADDEHDKFVWIRAKSLPKVKPTHKDMDTHLIQLLKKVKQGLKGNSPRERAARRASEQTGSPFRGTLYRGVEEDISKARRNRVPSQFAVGQYWTDNPEIAETYGDQVVSRDVALNNPYVLKLGEEAYFTTLRKVFGTKDPAEITRILKGKGYDGLIVKNVPVHRRKPDGEYVVMRDSTEYILFNKKRARRKQANALVPTRFVRQIPGPGDDLREAILVGDEVEIFLKEQAQRGDNPDPDFSGVVDKRNRNTIWIKPLDESEDEADQLKLGKSLVWKNDGSWAFIRVYRDPDQVIHYVKGNPYDGDKKALESAKGLGLILESETPDNYESVWALMRGETPDLDRSMGQAPMSMDMVAPFAKPREGIPPILHRVREVLRDSRIEPDLVDHLGNGRVLILTQDPDMKKDIVRVLQKGGVEIKAHRSGGIVVRSVGRRQAEGTTTIPIETDDKLMKSTVLQRKRRLEREAAGTINIQDNPTTVNNPNQGLSPQLSLTLPSQQQQINQLKGKYGDMKVQQLPSNKGTQLTFNNPQQLQRFQKDMQTSPSLNRPVSSRDVKWKEKVRRLGKGFRQAMRAEDYGSAGEFLVRMVGMGVGAETIIRSKLASRSGWEDLYNYAVGAGETEVYRLSRKASRMAPDL